MKIFQSFAIFALLLLLSSCGDDGGTGFNFQSDKCNSGQQATLTLNLNGIGTWTFEEGNSAVSHASDTEGSGIDAISMYMRWKDSATGDSLIFDVTVENETLAVDTYDYNDNPSNINGTVNFYIYKDGVEDSHYIFKDWKTTISEFDVYTTSSQGGYTTTKLAFIMASTSGIFTKVGPSTIHAFMSEYTICPRY
jgi:hypothetical protein